MRLLIVSHSYRPSISPRSIRWSAIAEHWARQGHEVCVVCGGEARLPRHEVIEKVHVYRPECGFLESRRAQVEVSNCAASRNREAGQKRAILASQVARLGYKVSQAIWRSLYWPDYACLWRRVAVKRARELLVDERLDALITVSLPFTGHLVGLDLKGEFPRIPWLADAGDPFCFMDQTPVNNFLLYRRANFRADRRVFSRADAITVTTPETRAEYGSRFTDSLRKMSVIPPLFSSTRDDTFMAARAPVDGVRRLVYAGTLYRSIRNPQGLLKLFCGLLEKDPRWQLHFVGALHDCQAVFKPFEQMFLRQIFMHGSITRSQALERLREADLLVNLGNASAYQLPSKVVEYAMLRRPVLNLTTIAEDTSANFFRKYPLALTIQENSGANIADQVERLTRFLASKPWMDDADWNRFVAPFQTDQVAHAYEQVLLGAVRSVGGDQPLVRAA